jgi:hypothetical protein
MTPHSRNEQIDMEGIMRKTRISIAVLAAFAIGSAAPLFAQTANDDPAKDPPAGGRIPASADTPQASGDTSSDEPSSAAGASSQSSQPGTTSQQRGTGSSQTQSSPESATGTSGTDGSAQGGQSGSSSSTGAAGSSDQPGQDQAAPSVRDADKAQTGVDPTGQLEQSGEGAARTQGQGNPQAPAQDDAQRSRQEPRSMRDPMGTQGRWHAQAPHGMRDYDYRNRYQRRGDAQRWDEGPTGWDDEGRSSRYPQSRDDYYRGDRYSDDARYYSRDRYGRSFDRDYRGAYDDRGWNAMGEFGSQDRWSRDMDRDYRGRGGRWSDLEEGSGYTYRDDYYDRRNDYYAGRDDYDPRRSRNRGQFGPERSGEHMGRGQSYYEDAYGDYRDPYRYREGGQWRGDRYDGRWQGNAWRDQQGPSAQQRWDRRDQPGAGTGDMTDPYQGDPRWQGGPNQGGQQWQQGQPSGDMAGQGGADAAAGVSQQGVTSPGAGSRPGTQAGSISGQSGTQSGSTAGSTGATPGTQSGSAVR